jgi:superfamily II helicase
MYIVLDVETKNLGSDIMKDNEQLLSLQLGDATKQELYYYDSKEPKRTLATGEKRIVSLLSQGVIFAGFKIKGFDIVMLKEFLGIEIPESKMLDLCLSPRLIQFTNKSKMRMEEACKVNDCSEKEFEEYVNNAFKIWEKRSQHQWKQDFGRYEKFIKNFRKATKNRQC